MTPCQGWDHTFQRPTAGISHKSITNVNTRGVIENKCSCYSLLNWDKGLSGMNGIHDMCSNRGTSGQSSMLMDQKVLRSKQREIMSSFSKVFDTMDIILSISLLKFNVVQLEIVSYLWL